MFINISRITLDLYLNVGFLPTWVRWITNKCASFCSLVKVIVNSPNHEFIRYNNRIRSWRNRGVWGHDNRQPQSNEGTKIICSVPFKHLNLPPNTVPFPITCYCTVQLQRVGVLFLTGCPFLHTLQDVEVTSPPDDSISCLAFSPPTMPGNFLIGGSWANDVSASSTTTKKNLVKTRA